MIWPLEPERDTRCHNERRNRHTGVLMAMTAAVLMTMTLMVLVLLLLLLSRLLEC